MYHTYMCIYYLGTNKSIIMIVEEIISQQAVDDTKSEMCIGWNGTMVTPSENIVTGSYGIASYLHVY